MSVRPPSFDGKDVAFSRIARLVRSQRPADVSRERAAESREEFRARLSAKLHRPSSPPRPVMWASAAAVATVVALGALLGVRHGWRATETASPSALPGVWDDQVKAHVRTAFARTGAAYAVDTYARVSSLFDRYSEALTSLKTDAPPQSSEVKKDCLDRRTGELFALTSLFARASEPGIVEHAVEAATALTDVRRCSEGSTFGASLGLPADSAVRHRVVAVRRRLDEAEGLARAGQYRRALELARPIAIDAASTGHVSLEADALSLLGVLEGQVGDFGAAEATLREGARAAARAHDDVQEVVILTNLFELVGHLMGRYEEGMILRDAADRAIERAGNPQALRARLASREAEVLQQGGRRDEALAAAERAVRLHESLGETSLELAHALLSHARILGGLERYEEAQRSAERALAIHRETLGPEHPEVGRSYKYVADFLMMRGRYAEARPYYEQAIAMAERSIGHQNKDVRGAYNGLAAVLHEEGRADDALRYYREALAISDAMATADASAAILLNMGVVLRGLARHDEAERACERALSLLENEQGNPINVPAALDCLGRLSADRGEHAKATAFYQRALSLYQGSSLDTPSHAATLVHLAQTYLAQSRPGKALPMLRRAAQVYDSRECDKGEAGDAHFALARALWQTHTDRGNAVTLARRALAEYVDVGPLKRDDSSKVIQWLTATASAVR